MREVTPVVGGLHGGVADGGPVFRMDRRRVALHRQAGLGEFGRDIVQLGVAGVGIDLVGLDVPFPGPDHPGDIARHLVALLGGAQGLLGGHGLRDLDRRDQDPADAVRRGRIGDGAVADGEVVDLLDPVARHLQRQLLEGEAAAGPGQDVFVKGADRGLEVGRGLVQPRAQGLGMPLAQGGGVGVVIDQDEVGPPAQGHRKVGGQDHVHGHTQTGRPGVAGADGGPGPVERADALGHHAAGDSCQHRRGARFALAHSRFPHPV